MSWSETHKDRVSRVEAHIVYDMPADDSHIILSIFIMPPGIEYLKHNWATTSDFQQWGILTSVDSDEPVEPLFKLRNSKWCSVSSLLKRPAKTDQTAGMHRLIWAFAGRTCHIVGNLVLWLILVLICMQQTLTLAVTFELLDLELWYFVGTAFQIYVA